MSDAANILNNTILIPTGGSLSSLSNATIGTDLQTYNKRDDKSWVKTSAFRVYINTGGKSIPLRYCEGIREFEVMRQSEVRRSGGNGSYTVKLPGVMNYNPVMFTHFYCGNDAFMNWMINGTDQGGIQRANIEIKVGQPEKHVVYTLRDAFPVSWTLGTMSIDVSGLVTNRETVTYTISENQILVENLTVVYSKIDVDLETTSWDET